MREWFKVEAAAKGKGGGEIMIYSYIGKRWKDENVVDAQRFVGELQGLVNAGAGDVNIRINSPGGDVADGMAIYNAIRSVKERCVCTIDSAAYSMASVIALAGRKTRMHDTGQYMLHNPRGGAYGTEDDLEVGLKSLRAAKAVLVKAYAAKTGKSDEEIDAMMKETTWITADRAKELGFVDEIIDGGMAGIAASFDTQAWADYYTGCGPMPVSDSDDGGDGVPVDNRDVGPMEVVMLTSKQIREACPGASAEFVLEQVEACEANAERTLVDVLTAHAAAQAKVIEAERAARAEAEKKAAEAEANAAKPDSDGVPPLAAGGADDDGPNGDPIAAFEGLIASCVKRGKSRREATIEAASSNPELHQAYLHAYNAQHGRVA